jgi:hypothetical protein
VRFEPSPEIASAFRFSWHEASSAEIREPKGRSFGLMMLCDVVPTSVSGSAELTFAPEGLHYELDVPRAQLVT